MAEQHELRHGGTTGEPGEQADAAGHVGAGAQAGAVGQDGTGGQRVEAGRGGLGAQQASAASAGPRPTRPRVLSIAGTDPTGGAGAQADLKSIMAAGGYGMSVITALVAQNTCGVREVHVPPPEFLQAQLRAVFEDVTVDAVKIGMLGNTATIAAVAEFLRAHPVPRVVLDPVMVATSGDRLLDADAEDALRELATQVDVVTPNIPELEILTGTRIAGDTSAAQAEAAVAAARQWARQAGTAVIVKFGHLDGEDAGNVAVLPDGTTHVVTARRIDTKNTHGTGCSLSSALAARLGRGDALPEALEWATRWLHGAIAAADGLQVGAGHGPVDHSAGVLTELSK